MSFRNTHTRSDNWYGSNWQPPRSRSRESQRWRPWNDWWKEDSPTPDGDTMAPPSGDTPAESPSEPAKEPIIRQPCGRITTPSTAARHFAGITCMGCNTDWLYSELYHRLCSICNKQFPEGLLSLRLRQAPFAKGGIGPESSAGILQCGVASIGVATAAAAHVFTSTMVADLPEVKADAKANAKATSKHFTA